MSTQFLLLNSKKCLYYAHIKNMLTGGLCVYRSCGAVTRPEMLMYIHECLRRGELQGLSIREGEEKTDVGD